MLGSFGKGSKEKGGSNSRDVLGDSWRNNQDKNNYFSVHLCQILWAKKAHLGIFEKTSGLENSPTSKTNFAKFWQWLTLSNENLLV